MSGSSRSACSTLCDIDEIVRTAPQLTKIRSVAKGLVEILYEYPRLGSTIRDTFRCIMSMKPLYRVVGERERRFLVRTGSLILLRSLIRSLMRHYAERERLMLLHVTGMYLLRDLFLPYITLLVVSNYLKRRELGVVLEVPIVKSATVARGKKRFLEASGLSLILRDEFATMYNMSLRGNIVVWYSSKKLLGLVTALRDLAPGYFYARGLSNALWGRLTNFYLREGQSSVS